MGQTADQIEHHIEQTRNSLGSNLEELEHKVKAVTDWKQHFQKKPMTMIGVAFGGGVLLATMLRGHRRNRAHNLASVPSTSYSGTAHRKNGALEEIDNIKGALIGVVATRFKDYVGDLIPGFKEQFDRTREERKKLKMNQSG